MTWEEKFWKGLERMRKEFEEEKKKREEERKKWEEEKKEREKKWEEEKKEREKKWEEERKEREKKWEEKKKQWEEERKEREKKWEEERKQWKEERKQWEKERKRELDMMMKRDKRLDRKIEKISDSFSMWLQGIVSPSTEKIFRKMGYKILSISTDQRVMQDAQVVAEYDIIFYSIKDGKEYLIVGEVGATISSKKIKEFIEKIEKIKEWLPKFKDCKVIGFIAGSRYGHGTDIFAMREGLYVFKPSDEQMKLCVTKEFIPKVW